MAESALRKEKSLGIIMTYIIAETKICKYFIRREEWEDEKK